MWGLLLLQLPYEKGVGHCGKRTIFGISMNLSFGPFPYYVQLDKLFNFTESQFFYKRDNSGVAARTTVL